VISVTYFALIRIDQQNHERVLQYKAKWWPIGKLPRLIFDHREMLDIALTRLQKKADTELIGPQLLGEPFTLTGLKKLYEAIFQQKLDAGNFRKKINGFGMLRSTGEKDKSGSKKGAFLYVLKPKTGWAKEEVKSEK